MNNTPKQSKLNRFLWFIPIIALLAWTAINPMNAELRHTDNKIFFSLTSILGAILILILLIERTTEILINLHRKKETDKIGRSISLLKREVKEEESKDLKTQIKNKLNDEYDRLFSYKNETRVRAIYIAFSLSVFVCLTGVGLLNEIFVIPLPTTDISQSAFDQDSLFRMVDVILTAGLMSGGTESFHKFMKTLEDFSGKDDKHNEHNERHDHS